MYQFLRAHEGYLWKHHVYCILMVLHPRGSLVSHKIVKLQIDMVNTESLQLNYVSSELSPEFSVLLW